jgi:hypothetical protein
VSVAVATLAISAGLVTSASAATTPPTATSLVLSALPASPQTAGTSVLFEVAITPITAVGTVALYDGSTLLASGSHYQSRWSFATSSLAAGTHTMKATFTPDNTTAYGSSSTTFTDVVTAATPSCSLSVLLVPSCGVLWGSYKPPGTGETWVTTTTDLEAQAGRAFDIVYRYHDFSGTLFPDKSEQTLAGSGHILLEDWAPTNFTTGAKFLWADIAAGKYDASVIDPEAANLKAYGKPVMLSFDHEMDNQVGTLGTAADYVAAYRHIENTFDSLGVTNVVWVWTITGYAGHDSLYSSLYPGSSYVDWVGYDPYNFASCKSTAWKTFNQTIDPAYQFLESNGFGNKPFILPEYGTVQDPTNTSAAATWFSQIPAGLAAHPNIKALLAWDDGNSTCNERLTGPGEFAAFAAAGLTPALATNLG